MEGFTLRIDVDTRVGTRQGIPRLLDALRKNDLKASFYVNVGREANPLKVMWLTKILKKKTWYSNETRPHKSKISRSEFFRRIIKPVKFARENVEVLRRIIEEGHELGAHAFHHEEWALLLDEMDVRKEFELMIKEFNDLFGFKPKSFAAPTFRTNKQTLKLLDAYGFACAGDLEGDEPFHPVVDGEKLKCVQVPVNLKCNDTVPLIEHYWLLGKNSEENASLVFKAVKEKIDSGVPAVLYGHDLLEGAIAPRVMEGVLRNVKKAGFDNYTCLELAKEYENNFKKVVL